MRKSPTEMSNKEKLRQMRQIRHKLINPDEKLAKPPSEDPPKIVEPPSKSEFTITLAKTTTETQTRKTEVEMKSSETQTKTTTETQTRKTEVEMKSSETQTKSSETQTVSKDDSKEKSEKLFSDDSKEKSEKLFSGKTLRSDFTIKTSASKDLCSKQAIVQTKRLDLSDRNLAKMLPRITYTKQDKPKSEVVEKKVQSTKSLQQQISKLHQQSLPKPNKEMAKVEVAKQEKKVSFSNDKPHILNTQYPSGFTVSKIEAVAKMKPETKDNNQDKRPSLEITLINPTPSTEVTSTVTVPKQAVIERTLINPTPSTEVTSTVTVPKQAVNTTTKRPLPATIPLERIKSIKSVASLSGNPLRAETKIELNKNGLNPSGNGLKPLPGTTTDKGPLSNLQMLSKVATEHANINKSISVQSKPRQQMPSLQNIKVPNVQNQPGNKPANLAKIPKLNEITKGQFRITNSTRTMRPNQNESVDIIHDGEVLPSSFTLMDVAYSFKWKRAKPMRFFYRIFTPMKIRPIRIINTSSTGQKHLQIVPLHSEPKTQPTPPPPLLDTSTKRSPSRENTTTLVETEENSKEKERLMAELQLQSKAKFLESQEKTQNSRYGETQENRTGRKEKDDQFKEKRRKTEPVDQTAEDTNCIFDYEEPDKEELKRFAEKRDREWQMIKHSDDEHRAYKKRKKNKHSKGEKRKLHAEITSELSNKQESIKLKVKLTPHNGHRHSKHNKAQIDGKSPTEMSNKEKLRQMRQIRHKLINPDDKLAKPPSEDPPKIAELPGKSEFTITLAKTTTETQTRKTEVEMKSSETQTKSSETQTVSKDDSKEKSEKLFSGKTLRSDFTIKTSASKDLCSKQAIVQTERLDLSDRNLAKMLPRITYTKQDKPKSEVVEKKAQSTKSLQEKKAQTQ
ncbi:hypothetical protein QE152_g29980 [Popillia japonica]|uniref:RAWUL domain-containing protein n=1 Tax=Popillia japonica TaxID=7064 RepID=A0AAW1JFY2_POPJA